MRDLIMEFVCVDGQRIKFHNNNWQAMDRINELFEQQIDGHLECNLHEIKPLPMSDNWTNFQPQAQQWVLNCLRTAKKEPF